MQIRLLHFFSTLFTATAWANGGGYLVGVKSTGPFRPVNVEKVQMVSEKLDIELRENAAVVSITYVLHNPGRAVTVEMGFPCSVVVQDPSGGGLNQATLDLPQLEEFKLTADAKPLSSKLMKDHAVLSRDRSVNEAEASFFSRVVTGWQVVKLPFSADQTRVVRVAYANPWFRSTRTVSDDSYSSPPSMRYLFSAAALWDGPIRKGEVTIRATGVSADLVRINAAKRFKRVGDSWTWEFTDLEPAMTDDLEIIAGEAEMSMRDYGAVGPSPGYYTVRGAALDFDELQKTGRWYFTGNHFTAKASSSLKPDADFAYGPENLADRDWSNAWVEGVEGDGIGESVTLTMKNPQKATSLIFYNGYRKSRQTYTANNRIKSAAVSLNGKQPFTVEFKDSFDGITRVAVPGDTGPLKSVQLTIQSVYPGEHFRDTSLTGVEVEVPLTRRPNVKPAR